MSNEIDMSNQADVAHSKRACIRCCSKIDSAATFCHVCSGYQNKARNLLVYIASIIGLFTVLASAATFVLTSLPELRKILWWRDDIAVTRFSLVDGIRGFNRGDGRIYLSHVLISWPHKSGVRAARQYIEPIRMFVNAGDSFSIPFERAAGDVAENLSDEEWAGLSRNAQTPDREGACIVMEIAGESEPEIVMNREHLRSRFHEISLSAAIYYYSMEGDEAIQKQIPVTGFLYRRRCASPG